MELRRRSPEDRLQYMEDQVIRLAVERNAALSVLRELVAVRDGPILALNSERGPIRAKAFEAAWARARRLVAAHTTDEEQQT